ncbi:class I SAM-dependent methyltransferase [Dyella kyungheensis]|uniref:class I SAM-dependent methyltransferase n=1 Tax=Dyella kyungheensis TaxID=1242174 RepID=UPI003CF59B62
MPYAKPRHIEDVNQCYFYHTMDLPEIGTVAGNWDLRASLPAYLGGFQFSDKRALDIGCASGILSFYMESQGAEVVSYDLDKSGDWDMVPFAKWEHYEHIAHERKSIIDRLNNAYWLAHRLNKSKAKVVYGDVYSIPSDIGPVDVSVFGSNLLHFRDPFLALQNGLRLTRETVIVTDVLRSPRNAIWPVIHGAPEGIPALDFLPDARTVEPKDTWWDITPQWVIRAVGVLGFEDVQVTYHAHPYDGVMNQLFTVVAKRTHGRAVGEMEKAA